MCVCVGGGRASHASGIQCAYKYDFIWFYFDLLHISIQIRLRIRLVIARQKLEYLSHFSGAMKFNKICIRHFIAAAWQCPTVSPPLSVPLSDWLTGLFSCQVGPGYWQSASKQLTNCCCWCCLPNEKNSLNICVYQHLSSLFVCVCVCARRTHTSW